jgi:hypothetical protein
VIAEAVIPGLAEGENPEPTDSLIVMAALDDDPEASRLPWREELRLSIAIAGAIPVTTSVRARTWVPGSTLRVTPERQR